MYDLKTREWGTTTSEGNDIRDVAYSNYFPATFGTNFEINSTSRVEDYEHIEAISVGVGVTYLMKINQEMIESCPHKYEIFKAIKTWENARAANAFPRQIKKLLANPEKNWTLKEGEIKDVWYLCELINGEKIKTYTLTRGDGY